MKNLLRTGPATPTNTPAVFVLLFVLFALVACDKRSGSNNLCTKPGKGQETSLLRKTGKGSTITDVSCKGSCGNDKCFLTAADKYVQCNCNNCSMQVIIYKQDSSGSSTDTAILADGEVEVQFLQSFKDYMAAEHPAQAYGLDQVTIVNDDARENYFITYAYTFSTGVTGTVSFEHEAGSGKNMTVDCRGTCDCRERYFPGTGAIECTCKDCSMTITQLAASAWDAQ